MSYLFEFEMQTEHGCLFCEKKMKFDPALTKLSEKNVTILIKKTSLFSKHNAGIIRIISSDLSVLR